MKVLNALMAGGVAVVLVCAGCGKQAEKKAAAESSGTTAIKLSYSVMFPPSHSQAKLAVAWAEEIKRRTAGRVAITVVPNGALTKADQCYQGVVAGKSDLGMSAFAYTPERFPLLAGLDLPVGYPDGVTATRIANSLAMKYKPAEARDVKLLYVHAQGPWVVAARRPVVTLAQMKGLRVCTAGSCSNLVERLSGTPVCAAPGEAYEALHAGLADAVFCPFEALKDWRLADVVNCITDSRCIGSTTAFFVAINKATWSLLPEDVQKVFEAVSAEWVVKHGQAWDAADAEGYALMKELKRDYIPLTVTQQAEWGARVQPLLQEYVARLKTQRLPGDRFLKELQAALQDARGTLRK